MFLKPFFESFHLNNLSFKSHLDHVPFYKDFNSDDSDEKFYKYIFKILDWKLKKRSFDKFKFLLF